MALDPKRHIRFRNRRGQKVESSFTWGEARSKDGAMPPRLGFVNGRPVRVRQGVRRQAARLQKLRSQVNRARRKHGLKPTGLNVLSWYRSPAHNKNVGGASDSRHMYGDACDIALQEIDRLCPWKGGRAHFDRIADRVFRDGGLGTYPAGNRHVDTRGYRARWSSF